MASRNRLVVADNLRRNVTALREDQRLLGILHGGSWQRAMRTPTWSVDRPFRETCH